MHSCSHAHTWYKSQTVSEWYIVYGDLYINWLNIDYLKNILKNKYVVWKSFLYFVSCRLPYFETSAKNGQNVAKSIECLLDMVMLRMESCVDKSQLPGIRSSAHMNGYHMDEAGEGGCGCWESLLSKLHNCDDMYCRIVSQQTPYLFNRLWRYVWCIAVLIKWKYVLILMVTASLSDEVPKTATI